MADDMATQNGDTFDPRAQWARLSERVENQGKDIIDLRSNMNTGFQNVQSAITSLTNEFRGSTKTQWPVIWSAIGVALSFAVIVGGMAYWPIRENTSDLKVAVIELAKQTNESIKDLAASTVSRQEMDWRAARGAEDRARTEKAIDAITTDLVPRGEHERVWQNYDQRFMDQQRQIDEVKAAQGSTYNARDVILDMRERLDRLERERAQAWRGSPPS